MGKRRLKVDGRDMNDEDWNIKFIIGGVTKSN